MKELSGITGHVHVHVLTSSPICNVQAKPSIRFGLFSTEMSNSYSEDQLYVTHFQCMHTKENVQITKYKISATVQQKKPDFHISSNKNRRNIAKQGDLNAILGILLIYERVHVKVLAHQFSFLCIPTETECNLKSSFCRQSVL